MIREPQAKGFYPHDKDTLTKMLSQLLTSAEKTAVPNSVTHGVVPHAGYLYSGLAAAILFKSLKPASQIIILGVDHFANCSDICLHTYDSWKTPLGSVRVSSDLTESIAAQLDPELTCSSQEHSIEVQLPFLQYLWGSKNFEVLPITVPAVPKGRLRDLGEVLSKLPADIPIIASSDMTHFRSKSDAMKLDAMAIDRIVDVDPIGLLSTVDEFGISMCGVYPVSAMLHSLPTKKKGKLMVYYTSGDITGDEGSVVGYASIGFGNL
ncbi:MAG: AmmeMemoRadiSam system protein B [Candidatus Altiarchaeota archaeon]|nr:AmmeMemoRadiSam system protein B [Candidatus Altiarchaeota archaeon]